MKNYKESDYAINKYSESIVYRFANEKIEVTLEDYLLNNPDKTEEDFKELKKISDEIYHEQVKKENSQTRLNLPLYQFENEVPIDNQSLEDEYIKKLDKNYLRENFETFLKSNELTDIQKSRFIKYIIQGYSLRQIATQEKREYSSIRESVNASIKKFKNFK